MKFRRPFYLSGLRSTLFLSARHCRLVGKACTMAERPDACRASLAPDSSMRSNIGLPIHDLGGCSYEYHDSTSCPTYVALVHGITASTGAISVWAPFYPISIYAVLLCFSISCPRSLFLRLPQESLPGLFGLHFVETYCFSSLLSHPEPILWTGRALTHLACLLLSQSPR